MKNKTVGRLINDEQLKHLLNGSEYYGTHAWDEFCDMISECDAVDAVQVVRCDECNKSNEWPNGRWCRFFRASVNTDSYCSFGAKRKERREG